MSKREERRAAMLEIIRENGGSITQECRRSARPIMDRFTRKPVINSATGEPYFNWNWASYNAAGAKVKGLHTAVLSGLVDDGLLTFEDATDAERTETTSHIHRYTIPA